MKWVPLAALTLVLAACGSGEESTDEIESDVAAAYAEQAEKRLGEPLDFDAELECPTTAKMGSGDSFECVLYDSADKSVSLGSIEIKFQNDAGEYIWKVVS